MRHALLLAGAALLVLLAGCGERAQAPGSAGSVRPGTGGPAASAAPPGSQEPPAGPGQVAAAPEASAAQGGAPANGEVQPPAALHLDAGLTVAAAAGEPGTSPDLRGLPAQQARQAAALLEGAALAERDLALEYGWDKNLFFTWGDKRLVITRALAQEERPVTVVALDKGGLYLAGEEAYAALLALLGAGADNDR